MGSKLLEIDFDQSAQMPSSARESLGSPVNAVKGMSPFLDLRRAVVSPTTQPAHSTQFAAISVYPH
jgi:hypothetical protein